MPETDPTPSLHVVLFRPDIPQNTGNIGRTCVAVGAKLWLVRPLGFRVDEKALRRAGMDYWRHLDWEVVDDVGTVTARHPDAAVWKFTVKGTGAPWDVAIARGDILLFGSESRGLPDRILEQNPDRNIRLPMRPEVRSLNLAST
ncbi:MAG: tRNA (cytidine(34)-2'-O)-methyltransferase, partial [Planctomycetota bacterium]